jgi:coatomer subunit epsilon
MSDPLFNVLNHFHCGAYQLAINAAQELDGLPPSVALERDCIVYRAYLALGNHQVRTRWQPHCRSRCEARLHQP